MRVLHPRASGQPPREEGQPHPIWRPVPALLPTPELACTRLTSAFPYRTAGRAQGAGLPGVREVGVAKPGELRDGRRNPKREAAATRGRVFARAIPA